MSAAVKAEDSCRAKLNSEASVWLCCQDGILPSQYAPRAIDKLIANISSSLKAVDTIHMCSQGIGAHSAFLQDLSMMCLPILLNPKVLPIVEQLISNQQHCSDLSEDFLRKVTALQKGEGSYMSTPKLNLSYEVKVKLWVVYPPSFKEELIELLTALTPVGMSQSEMETIISARQVPRACLEHNHLMLFTEEVLKVLYVSANSSSRIKQVVDSFNSQLMEAHRKRSHPTLCTLEYPQLFSTDKWKPQPTAAVLQPEQ